MERWTQIPRELVARSYRLGLGTLFIRRALCPLPGGGTHWSFFPVLRPNPCEL